MKVLALTLLLVAVTAAQWRGGPPTRNDAPPSGGLMSGQIGGRSVQIENRFVLSLSPCNICKYGSDTQTKHMGCEERCKKLNANAFE